MKRIVLSLVIISSFMCASDYSKKQIAEYIIYKIKNEPSFSKHKIEFYNHYCSLKTLYNDEDKSTAFINLKDTVLTKYIDRDTSDAWIAFDCKTGDCISTTISNGKKYPGSFWKIYTNKTNNSKLFKAFEDLSSKCSGVKELY